MDPITIAAVGNDPDAMIVMIDEEMTLVPLAAIETRKRSSKVVTPLS